MGSVRVKINSDQMAALGNLAERITAKVTEAIYDDARRTVPVDEGDLRESLDWATEGTVGQVTVGTDHWEYVEYGTRNMDAQPYMRPSLYRKRVIDL